MTEYYEVTHQKACALVGRSRARFELLKQGFAAAVTFRQSPAWLYWTGAGYRVKIVEDSRAQPGDQPSLCF